MLIVVASHILTSSMLHDFDCSSRTYVSNRLENILISDERVALCDWGLCEKMQPNKLLHTTRGSMYYSCPEILRHEDVDGKKTTNSECFFKIDNLLFV